MYIIYDDLFLKHFTGDFHPENSNRLSFIMDKLKESEILRSLKFESPSYPDESLLALVHSDDYIRKIRDLSQPGVFYYLDADTIVTEYTFSCAMLAAGACKKGIDIIINNCKADKESHNHGIKFSISDRRKTHFPPKGGIVAVLNSLSSNSFFALVRPPGHHASRNKGSGFCIFNNIAVAASYAINKYKIKRVAIIDFDVHHGNGTQDIFYNSREVFYVSVHQYPHYPGTGYYNETGAESGKGFNLNIPLTPFSEEIDYLTAFVEIIIPVLYNYEPQLILVSAGFDAHRDDLLSNINLTDDSYFKIVSLIKILACLINLKNDDFYGIGMVLEGGYNYNGLWASVNKTIRVIDSLPEESFKEVFDKFAGIHESVRHSNRKTQPEIKLFIEHLKDLILNDYTGSLIPNNQNKITFEKIKEQFKYE